MGGKQAPERLHTDLTGVARAATLLRAGEVVALPTETVYGLAGRADSEQAVAAIYRAKGRPLFNPLIVHVASLDDARRLAHFDNRAERLAGRFWPGSLTMVLPAKAGADIVPAVTAGLPTIALRMPAHPAMMAVLKELGRPLAAPSANRSGAVSPTTADHVVVSLRRRLAAILDGGPCAQGIESTIVALRATGGWQILRPGPITEASIVEELGQPVASHIDAIEAPGQLASHYAPGKPVRLNADGAADDEFLIGFGNVAGDCSLSSTGDLAQAAARLYACLHLGAASAQPRIAIAAVPESGIGAAINDRLTRAAV